MTRAPLQVAGIELDIIETARLRGERLRRDHFDEICRMHRDARVMATLGGLRDDAESMRYLDRNLAHWDQHGFGLWIVRDRTSGELTGRAVVRHLDVEGTDEVEIGYAFYPEYWGRGLATEVARACVAIGEGLLHVPSVVAVTLPTNQGSRAVLAKAGLVYQRTIQHAGAEHVLYRHCAPIEASDVPVAAAASR